uniref:Uncharacterized protein n=1 Tax=Arundo donax TaxID=35708 RepID=A0A0A9AZ80_ARUDO
MMHDLLVNFAFTIVCLFKGIISG